VDFEVQNCLLDESSLMMEVARTSETSVDNYFTRQYIPEDNSELQKNFNVILNHLFHVCPILRTSHPS
jgi:hypothetical protein